MSQSVPGSIVAARRVAGSVFILGLVVVLVAIALLANWWVTQPVQVAAPATVGSGLGGGTGAGSGGGASTARRASATPTKPVKKTGAQLEREAVAELQREAAADLVATYISGQWVAQLSSKYIGVEDDLQKTKTGSHVFKAVDILHEHQVLRKRFAKNHVVVLLRGEDFYPYKSKNGKTFWYTFVLDDSFGSEDDIKGFCRVAYRGLTGEARANRCLPRELGG